MTANKKAARMLRASATAHIEKHSAHFLIVRRFIKAVIVVSALRGWMPYPWADWLIQRGGLGHA